MRSGAMGGVLPLLGEESRTACPACGRTLLETRCEACGATRRAGRYVAVKVLGERPYSRTYLAFDPKYGEHVVLKELWFASVPGVHELEAFEREADLLLRVEHRRVPRLLKRFRIGAGPDLRLYLVREYVAGSSLASLARARRPDEAEAKHIARQVLRVLKHLHGLRPQVVHRDLRPHNLLIDRRRDVHLVGFGAARWLEDGLAFDGTLVGQPGYAPLEQLGGTLSASADLHGLGATLIHLLTGKDPFELMPRGERLVVPPNLGVSPAFDAFLRRLLAEPSQRFPNAVSAYAALTRSHPVADALERVAAWLRR